MQVKQRLKINIIVSVITAVILLLVLSVALYRVNRAMEKSELAGELLTDSFERVTFRDDYLRTNSERAKAQWFAKHREIAGHLASAAENFQDAEDKKTLDELLNIHASTKKIFSGIVENRKKTKLYSGSADLSHEIDNRLLTQLNMRVYEEVLHWRRLRESSRESLFSTLRLAGWGIAGVLVILIAVSLINSWVMGRIITDRILRLRSGASVIGGGDLDHRIDIKGNDEFAELSDSFNAMTEKLLGSQNYLRNEIEERKRTEEALRTSERRYHSLFENMVEGCAYCKMLFDDRGRPADFVYLDVNSAFGRLTGLENVIGKKVTDAIPGTKESHPELFEIYGRVALTGSPEKIDIEFTPLNIWLSLSVFSVEKGYFVVVFENISERKNAEEALRKAYDELEARIQDRTKELRELNETLEQRVAKRTAGLQAANATLRDTSRAALNMMEDAFDARRQAEEASAKLQTEIAGRVEAEEQIEALNEQLKLRIDELISANKELESFSYSVSHDLRAPLRHLTGFAELLKKRVGTELDEKSREYVEFISGAAVQMGKLIDDLLSFSRAGRVEMKRQQMHLDVMVRGVIRSIGNEAEGRDVEWKTQALPEVSGDPSLLKLVWTNLISNALKFTRTEKHAIIEIGSRDEGNEYVFFIKDNGVGFDMRFKDKLFAIFQRLHSPTEFEGTGVGLANVQRIVSRHGGRVWAESIVGEGATFYFTLPK